MKKETECKLCREYDAASGLCTAGKDTSSCGDTQCAMFADSGEYGALRRKPPYAAIIFILLLLGALSYGGWRYFEHREKEQRREEIVWKARCELELFCADKTIEYLRMDSIKYSDGLLSLVYRSSMPEKKFHKNMSNDSLVRLNFLSTAMINPSRWKTISEYLSQAEVDMKVTMRGRLEEKSFTISCDSLSALLADEDAMAGALKLFVARKAIEVDGYARQYFSSDKYMKPMWVSVGNDFVELHMLYDDNHKLGVYGNGKTVPAVFRDPVGDMGSILDGMLNICSRTGKGFAFVYVGKKTKKQNRVEWSADAAEKMTKANNGMWFEGRKTKNFKTLLYKQ